MKIKQFIDCWPNLNKGNIHSAWNIVKDSLIKCSDETQRKELLIKVILDARDLYAIRHLKEYFEIVAQWVEANEVINGILKKILPILAFKVRSIVQITREVGGPLLALNQFLLSKHSSLFSMVGIKIQTGKRDNYRIDTRNDSDKFLKIRDRLLSNVDAFDISANFEVISDEDENNIKKFKSHWSEVEQQSSIHNIWPDVKASLCKFSAHSEKLLIEVILSAQDYLAITCIEEYLKSMSNLVSKPTVVNEAMSSILPRFELDDNAIKDLNKNVAISQTAGAPLRALKLFLRASSREKTILENDFGIGKVNYFSKRKKPYTAVIFNSEIFKEKYLLNAKKNNLNTGDEIWSTLPDSNEDIPKIDEQQWNHAPTKSDANSNNNTMTSSNISNLAYFQSPIHQFEKSTFSSNQQEFDNNLHAEELFDQVNELSELQSLVNDPYETTFFSETDRYINL